MAGLNTPPNSRPKTGALLRPKVVVAAVAVAMILIGALVLSLNRSTGDGPMSNPNGSPDSSDTRGSASGLESPTAGSLSTTTLPEGASPTKSNKGSLATNPPLATTKVPGGPSRPTKPPVSLTAPATPIAGLTTRLTRIEKVQGLSNLPGEIAGPSLRITVEYENGTPSTVDLRGAVVNVYFGSGLTPAIMLSQPGAKPFPSSIATGQKAQGTFVFNVPTNARQRVRVEVDLANQGSVVLYQGAVV